MILTIRLIILSSLLTVLSGCIFKEEEKEVNNTPPALLKNDGSALLSYSSRHDLVEALYQDLLSGSPELNKLEKVLTKSENEEIEAQKIFHNFTSRSENYYLSANKKARDLKDPILKQQFQLILSKSENKFRNKVSGLNILLKALSNNRAYINDKLTALKLTLTLPLIEQYQNKNMPDDSDLKSLIKDQNLLLKKVNNLLQ